MPKTKTLRSPELTCISEIWPNCLFSFRLILLKLRNWEISRFRYLDLLVKFSSLNKWLNIEFYLHKEMKRLSLLEMWYNTATCLNRVFLSALKYWTQVKLVSYKQNNRLERCVLNLKVLSFIRHTIGQWSFLMYHR